MNRKIRILIAVLVAVVAAGAALYVYLNNHTYFLDKLFAAEVKADKAEEIGFHYNNEDVLKLKSRYFVPEESGEYVFTISDIKNSEDTAIGVYVANDDFTEFLIADIYAPDNEEEDTGDSTFLQKGEKCYISLVIIPVDDEEEIEPYDGSFTLTVSKKPAYVEPPLLTVEENALLTISPDDRACARFIPPETGYYRFDTAIQSSDASSGFSSVSSIISPESMRTQITEGIAHLEKEKEYYIWVTVHETGDSSSEVSLSVSPMTVINVTGASEITLTEDTMIEYHAEGDGNMAVYSSSDGNPNALIYEKAGFALRTDEDGEDSLSENDKDFAMVFGQKDGRNYCIGVYGDIGSECKVTIVPYIGDGSSLTLEDIDLAALEKIEAEAAAEAESESEPEQGIEAEADEGEADGTDTENAE